MGNVIERICLTVLLVLSFFIVNAQFGLKGGLNLSELTGAGYQAKRSVNLGGYAHLPLNDKWALQPEIIFSAQGAKQIISEVKYKTYISYANTPVLLQYMFGNGFRLQSGPQFGILASARQEVEGEGTSVDITNNLKATDFSWVFGVSYISYKKIGFDIRVVPGITKISKKPPNIGNNVFQASIFYQFKRVNKTTKLF